MNYQSCWRIHIDHINIRVYYIRFRTESEPTKQVGYGSSWLVVRGVYSWTLGLGFRVFFFGGGGEGGGRGQGLRLQQTLKPCKSLEVDEREIHTKHEGLGFRGFGFRGLGFRGLGFIGFRVSACVTECSEGAEVPR